MGIDDTHPRVRAVMGERIRAMTYAERFAMLSEITDFVCDQSMAAIRCREGLTVRADGHRSPRLGEAGWDQSDAIHLGQPVKCWRWVGAPRTSPAP